MRNSDREAKLKQVRDDVIDCSGCQLRKIRQENNYLPVIGEGNHNADVIFIGEAPGLNEAKTGRPFCGHAGNILNELLESVNLPRNQVYICNILKDRPPGNRNPQKDEIEACVPYLDRQLEAIAPKIIATLGNYATAFIMEKYNLKQQIQGISKIHGRVFDTDELKIIPLYHPAVAVYNANMKDVLKQDFQVIKDNYGNKS